MTRGPHHRADRPRDTPRSSPRTSMRRDDIAWYAITAFVASLTALGTARAVTYGAGIVGVAAVSTCLVYVRRRQLLEVILLGAVVSSASVDFPRNIHFGAANGGAVLTVLFALLLPMSALLGGHHSTRDLYPPLAGMGLFLLWVAGSLLYHSPSTDGVQNLLVWVAFTGMILSTAVAVRRRPQFASALLGVVVGSGGLACFLYLLSVARSGLGSDAIVSPRAFALYALVLVSCGLGLYRSGRQRGIWLALAATLVIMLSLSRLAFATALVLCVAGSLDLSSFRGWTRLAIRAFGASLILAAAVEYIPALHHKFFHGQLVSVGGLPLVGALSVNVNGRLDLWESTWRSFLTSPLIGHGAGASEILIDRLYGQGAGQPHNDYLRLLNDYGAVGFALWVVGFGQLLSGPLARLRGYSGVPRGVRPAIHRSALLALAAVAFAMLTDNVLIYLPILLPVGALVGLSLGISATPSAGAATGVVDDDAPALDSGRCRAAGRSPSLEAAS
jgi:O-antigen ligase